ncbi:hypothetical protein BDN72DRAFT_897763 [Pluteus cervinus]|uniref:Uncharacterized protein n=1 Tax=Pluteus cervinus TaxID=181527 RepID=A0ACD3AU34_9AGAR|nr:hypothetical protein BDN72DRAFT_897763 [Pluteus cervinus]
MPDCRFTVQRQRNLKLISGDWDLTFHAVEEDYKDSAGGRGDYQSAVDRLYSNLLATEEWIEDVHAADAILVAASSQRSVVATHLLVRGQHIKTREM